MTGTMLLLKRAGYELHYMTVSKAPWVEILDALPRKSGDGVPFGERDQEADPSRPTRSEAKPSEGSAS